MSYSAFSRPPQPRPGLKLTVRFVIRERDDGRPIITIQPVADYCNLISVVGNPRWFMPWEERLKATVTFPTERDELRHYICEQLMLWCKNPAGGSVVQATDDRIILTGIREVLREWRTHAQEATESRGRDERRIWAKGPVMSRMAEQFIGLFRWVEVQGINEWAEVVKTNRDGWGDAFKELVKRRRELVVGETKLLFWSSEV
ncbi:hypothetical protein QBC32DRAFT_61876 [Pseudoneurospora amorphoporcata]|uniref:Uncharacterized protein n=1 Tax=Pseudoneurospora amorphoporcata TaxID=241081 RepID=A0AAN6NM14_9PEZI|nr:hypothetical protein QBC32DRAFT_61876 [Pseudoneurospora amorphoporcata]